MLSAVPWCNFLPCVHGSSIAIVEIRPFFVRNTSHFRSNVLYFLDSSLCVLAPRSLLRRAFFPRFISVQFGLFAFGKCGHGTSGWFVFNSQAYTWQMIDIFSHLKSRFQYVKFLTYASDSINAALLYAYIFKQLILE